MAFTYFFRDLHTLELGVKNMAPLVAGRSNVKIWDAGCAMGQEPYTLAILFAENMGRFAFKNLQIYATDIDESNLFEKIIINGVYPEKELKRIPKDLFEKYFKPNGKAGQYQINHLIKNRVRYQSHDLLTLEPIGENFSMIVCKNVLLHLKYEERIKVIKMFHNSLTPGGFFITEQTQRLPKEAAHLFTRVTSDAQLFRKV
ncbi:chemotaxis protein CheR [candidate division KSB1 bacterium]|nr:MAG: chemotaxis protein CheR [candidate division KSB1 bacterium]